MDKKSTIQVSYKFVHDCYGGKVLYEYNYVSEDYEYHEVNCQCLAWLGRRNQIELYYHFDDTIDLFFRDFIYYSNYYVRWNSPRKPIYNNDSRDINGYYKLDRIQTIKLKYFNNPYEFEPRTSGKIKHYWIKLKFTKFICKSKTLSCYKFYKFYKSSDLIRNLSFHSKHEYRFSNISKAKFNRFAVFIYKMIANEWLLELYNHVKYMPDSEEYHKAKDRFYSQNGVSKEASIEEYNENIKKNGKLL